MKILLTILIFCTSITLLGQSGNDSSRYIKYPYNYGTRQPRIWTDSVMQGPRDTTHSKYGFAQIGSIMYVGNGTFWTASGNVNLSTSNGTVKTYGEILYYQNLDFYNTPLGYYINNIFYTAIPDTVTLSTGNALYQRQDVIYADKLGHIGVLEGIPGLPALKPQVDPDSQIELTVVIIGANGTVPINIFNTLVYSENIEWQGTSNLTGTDFSSTTHTYAGTVNASFPSGFTPGQYIQWQNLAGTISSSNVSYLKFYIRLDAAMSNNAYLSVKFLNNTTGVSNYVNIRSGQWGFSRLVVGSYQPIVMPISAFTFYTADFDRMYFTTIGTTGVAFHIDDVSLQQGGTTVNSNGVNSFNGRKSDVLPIQADYAPWFKLTYGFNADSTYQYVYNSYGLIDSIATLRRKIVFTGGATVTNGVNVDTVNVAGGSGGPGGGIRKLDTPDSTLLNPNDSLYNVNLAVVKSVWQARQDSLAHVSAVNLKQNLVTLTTTGSSGAATLNQSTGALNIPSYSGGGGGDTSKWTIIGSAIYPKSFRNTLIGTSTDDGHMLRVDGTISFNIGSDATGDIWYRNALGTFTRLPAPTGFTKPVLGYTATAPIWQEDSTGSTNAWTISGANVYRSSGFVGIGTSTPLAALHIDNSFTSGLDSSRGIYLNNSASSPVVAIGVNGNSTPSVVFKANGYNNTTGTSVPVVWYNFLTTVGGTTAPSSILYWYSSQSNSTPINRMQLTSAGALTTTGTITAPNVAGNSSIGAPVIGGAVLSSYNGYNFTSPSFDISNSLALTRTTGTNMGYIGLRIRQATTNSGGTNYDYGIQGIPILNNTGGTNYFRMYSFSNVNLNNTVNTDLSAFFNSVGNNYLNAASSNGGTGSTLIGDSILTDQSALLEVKSTTQGFRLPRMTKALRNKIIGSFTGSITTGGTGYTNAIRSDKPLTGGSGTGAVASITVVGGIVTSVTITKFGSGYAVSDVLSSSSIGAGTSFTYTISAITAPVEGLQIYQTDNTPGLRTWNGVNWIKYTEATD